VHRDVIRAGFIAVILGIWPIVAEGIAEERSDLLLVKPMGEGLVADIGVGRDPRLAGVDDGVVVVGLLDMPYFSVEDINRVAVYDADGRPLPLWVETASLYSEFDDGTINLMRIAFAIPEVDLEKGPLRLSWGDTVTSANHPVDRIHLHQADRSRYRTFVSEPQPRGNDAADFSSSVVVIVDDKADTYFLWYLLPLVLVFILLFVRKALIR